MINRMNVITNDAETPCFEMLHSECVEVYCCGETCRQQHDITLILKRVLTSAEIRNVQSFQRWNIGECLGIQILQMVEMKISKIGNQQILVMLHLSPSLPHNTFIFLSCLYAASFP